MDKLIYSAITSLDGYVSDEEGAFDGPAPDEEVHTVVNDLERPIGTYLHGRRMYEVMVYRETAHTVAAQTPSVLDHAELWQAADRIMYFDDAREGLQRRDADRTRLRPRSGARDEGVGEP